MKKLLVLREIDPTFLLPMFDSMTLTKDEDVSCVIFGGGTDVSPEMYGESKSTYTQIPDAKRDAHERDIFKWAFDKGIPMIGICRGAQLLTVMSGGKLIQHVTGHAIGPGIHQMTTDTGKLVPNCSTNRSTVYVV